MDDFVYALAQLPARNHFADGKFVQPFADAELWIAVRKRPGTLNGVGYHLVGQASEQARPGNSDRKNQSRFAGMYAGATHARPPLRR
jgi:hypothetical protein